MKVQQELFLAFRDKKQVKKLKAQDKGQEENQQNNQGYFRRLFTRNTQA